MKRLLSLAVLLVFVNQFLIAQNDTAIIYLSGYRETTKDSADSYIHLYKEGDLWRGRQYYIKNGVLKSEGTYKEKGYRNAIGTFTTYSEKGILKSIGFFDDSSKIVERTYFYDNGNKRGWIGYKYKGQNEQKCWDEAGNELSNCVLQREALFKGGIEAWKKFLERNLNANVAQDAGAPEGYYEVKVRFLIDKEGNVENLEAVQIPALCVECATEAIRVFASSPQWEPAIVGGEPASSEAVQYLTFVVTEQQKRRKKKG